MTAGTCKIKQITHACKHIHSQHRTLLIDIMWDFLKSGIAKLESFNISKPIYTLILLFYYKSNAGK
jgi:hypothetical protein